MMTLAEARPGIPIYC